MTHYKSIIHTALITIVLAFSFVTKISALPNASSKDDNSVIASNGRIKTDRLVKQGKTQFVLRYYFNVPADKPVLQKALAEKIFGNGQDLLDVACKKHLDGYKKVTVTMPKMLSKYDIVSMGCNDKTKLHNKGYHTYLYYVTRTVNNPQKVSDNNMYPKETRGYITYDAKSEKILTVADVFTTETIKKNMLDGSSTHIRMTTDSVIVYASAASDDEAKAKKFALIKNNKDVFVENIAAIISEPQLENGTEIEVFELVDQMPCFPGGTVELMNWLSENIKYPAIAEENGVQGRVIVRFVVAKDGAVYNPKVLRSVDPSLDKEALRVVKAMPRWIPGKNKGEAVNVYYTLPITFTLQ